VGPLDPLTTTILDQSLGRALIAARSRARGLNSIGHLHLAVILHELHLLPDARIPYASGVAHLRCRCQLLRVVYAVNTHRDTRSQTVRLSETLRNPPLAV
jgi:hypothetical protein